MQVCIHKEACIPLRRHSSTYTVDGNAPFVNDQLSPQINQGLLDRIEAQWSPAGREAFRATDVIPSLLFWVAPIRCRLVRRVRRAIICSPTVWPRRSLLEFSD